MDSKQVLVVRTSAWLTMDGMQKVHDHIVEQMKTGVVVIPPGYDALVVPEGLDVQVECEKEKEN